MNIIWASQVALVVKNPSANARDMGLIPGLGRPPAGGHGSPLRHSCLESPVDTGAWRATVHRVEKRQTRLSDLAHMPTWYFQAQCLATKI